jgi:hypothetical protein
MVIVPALPTTPPKLKIPGAYVAAESSSSAVPGFPDDLADDDDTAAAAHPLARQKIFYDALFEGRQVLLRAADSRHVRKLRAQQRERQNKEAAVRAEAERERERRRQRRRRRKRRAQEEKEEEDAEYARLLVEDLRKAQAAHRRAQEEEEFARLLEEDLRKAREAHLRAVVKEEEEKRRRAAAEEAARREEEERKWAEEEAARRHAEEQLRLQAEVEWWREVERRRLEEEEERLRWEWEMFLRVQAAEAERPQQEAEALQIYEAKWGALLRPGKGQVVVAPRSLGFGDVPWPLFGAVGSVEDVTWPRVREFVFHPQRSSVQGTYKAKSIRLELLRWHPDKFERNVLDKIVEGDREAVKEAAGNVARFLTELTMEA